MNKCLRIILNVHLSDVFLHTFIQKNARKLGLEGVAQMIDPKLNLMRITVCGPSEKLDQFVDLVYKATQKFDINDIEVEPFLKDKDYRSVFRVID